MNSKTPEGTLFSAFQEAAKVAESLHDEAKFQTKTALQGQLEKLDVVTREEFDATLASLERALQRVEQLEALLDSDS